MEEDLLVEQITKAKKEFKDFANMQLKTDGYNMALRENNRKLDKITNVIMVFGTIILLIILYVLFMVQKYHIVTDFLKRCVG